MGTQTKKLTLVSSSLLLGLLTLAGCNNSADTPQKEQPAAAASVVAAAAPQNAAYVPPTADQLSQMVAPIALFPDKLVGQVLAGATYPDQITAADQWLAHNPALKGTALQDAESSQPWDVSVKSLSAFPSVLDQMANNIQWTTALGQAYVNDPNDVMNAIQVLRARAQRSGNLASSQHLRIVSTARPPAPNAYPGSPGEPVVYAGPAVVQAPPQTILIEPAEPDVVYVPRYDPAVVYGAPVPVYPGWAYQAPRGIDTGTLVTAGALSFGAGILVGAAASHHDGGGWHSWGVNWGGPTPSGGVRGGWRRPAVVYNNATYVSKSVTVINQVNNTRVTNVVNNGGRTNYIGSVRNVSVHDGRNPANNPAVPPQQGMMSMPHFTHHDAVPGAHAPISTGPNTPPSHPVPSFAPAPRSFPTAPAMAQQWHQQPSRENAFHAARAPLPAASPMQHDGHHSDRITPPPALAAMPTHERDGQHRNMTVASAPPARPFAPAPQAAPSPQHDNGRDHPQGHAMPALPHTENTAHAEHADHPQHMPAPQAHAANAHHDDAHGKHDQPHHG